MILFVQSVLTQVMAWCPFSQISTKPLSEPVMLINNHFATMSQSQHVSRGWNHEPIWCCNQNILAKLDQYYGCWCSVHGNHRTCRTFPMAWPKCPMRDFTNLNRTCKAHWTNIWWAMKVFQLHCWCPGSWHAQDISSHSMNYTVNTCPCLPWGRISNACPLSLLTLKRLGHFFSKCNFIF